MSEEFEGFVGGGERCHHDICEHMKRFLGETVTIFTESGGESGSGFTGVLALVTPKFARLIVSMGTPPDDPIMYHTRMWDEDGDFDDYEGGRDRDRHCGHRRRDPCCPRRRRFCGLGSVVDIPCRKIVAFVHNAV